VKAARRLLLVALALLGAYVGAGLLAPQWLPETVFAAQRWRAGAERREAVVGDHRWVWLEAGPADAPLLVLVHGYTGSKENWLELMPLLADRYRLVAVDLPGWGESQRRAGVDYGALAQSERLAAFIATLPRTPALLAGHSMGGHVSGLLAAAQPQAIERLLLMSSAGVHFRENDFARAVARGENPFEVHDATQLRAQLRLVFAEPPFLPWPVDVALARRRAADAGFEREVLRTFLRPDEAFALQARLGRVQAPTLLLWCRDDRVIDASSVPLFRAGLRDARSLVYEDCGHMPMMERPGDVARAIAGFVPRD
jgi:pimeloyl-ACP methyl ester carboxylesterase